MVVRAGYKQTEVGIIPEDWQILTFDKIVTKDGLVRGPFGGTLKKEFFVKNGYKVYEQKNAIYRSYFIGDYFIDNKKYSDLIRFSIKQDDFIVSCSGTIGCIYQIPEHAPLGVINQALLKISLNSEVVDGTFFLYLFRSNPFQSRITENSHGGAMQNLVGMDSFRKTSLQLPPLKEQEAIAEVLSDTDALIESLKTLIAKKRRIKEGVMQELLTPKDTWVEKTLGDTALLKARIGWQGLTTAEYLNSGSYYLVTGTDFLNGKVDWNNCHFINEKRYNQDKYIQLRTKDVIVTKDGTIGKVAYIDNLSKPATLNSGVFVIRPINGSFHPEFFYYLLTSQLFTNFLNQLSAGSTINHLYQKDFVNFNFKTPKTIKEQESISTTLKSIDKEITQLEEKLSKAKKIKEGMMQELLTGRIRLL